jgi:hypothetical protein
MQKPISTASARTSEMPSAPEPVLKSSKSPEAMRRNRRWRLPFLVFGLSFFFAALYGGLWRLGWNLPHGLSLAEQHGPLMIGGFFGTLIGLERGVALGRSWVFAAPTLSCLAAALAIAGAPTYVSGICFVAAASVLAVASVIVLFQQPQLFTAVLALGAGCWAVGNACWMLGAPVADAAPWWLCFLVFTIAAERLDISRFIGVDTRGYVGFAACICLLLAGAAMGFYEIAGTLAFGAGLVSLSVWLGLHDIAFRNPRRAAHLRYFGFCMFTGYVWLAVAGVALIVLPPAATAFGYDLLLHAVLLGFVLSMAFGHSVIVIPALTGARAPFHPGMYVGLTLLHLSVALRVTADALSWNQGRLLSGPLTLIAMLTFAAALGWRIKTASRSTLRAAKSA